MHICWSLFQKDEEFTATQAALWGCTLDAPLTEISPVLYGV